MRRTQMRSRASWLAIGVACALGSGCAGAAGGDRLYRDLGERPGIEALVDVLLERIADDPRIVRRFKDTDIPHFNQMLVEQICNISGGPCRYTGDSMTEAHAGMDLNHADFNALVEDLIAAMNQRKLSMPAQNRLLALLAPMRPDVIHK